MKRKSFMLLVFVLVAATTYATYAEERVTVQQLLDGDARRLTAEEITKLLPGTHVKNIAANGSERKWTFGANGTIGDASSNRGGVVGAAGTDSGHGKYNLTKAGEACIALQWQRGKNGELDKFCHTFFVRKDGRIYAASRSALANPGTTVSEYVFPSDALTRITASQPAGSTGSGGGGQVQSQ